MTNFQISLDTTKNNCQFIENKYLYPTVLALWIKLMYHFLGSPEKPATLWIGIAEDD